MLTGNGLVVGEYVELLGGGYGHILLVNYLVHSDGKSAHQQFRVYCLVKQLYCCLGDEACRRGGMGEKGSSMSRLGSQTTVIVADHIARITILFQACGVVVDEDAHLMGHHAETH